MNTLDALIERLGLTLETQPVASNPHMNDDGKWQANHFRCTLTRGRREMNLYFSKGSGLHGVPELPEVLDCLASDAAGVENAQSFEDWCSEYGYDTDSRKAERTYNICQEQARELRDLLGDEDYKELLWNTERL